MSSRSFTVLVSPLAAGGKAPAAVVPVTRILRDAGARVQTRVTTDPRDAIKLIDDAVADGDVVVSAGGDGTLSSVAGPVANRGGTLGILPAGRGNDFMRMLGLSAEPADIADVLLHGHARPVDLLRLSMAGTPERVVVSSVYAGVDAVASTIADRVRWMPAKLQYPYAAVRSLATYGPLDAHVVVDGAEHRFHAATVVVANSGYYGSGMRIAPSASVLDGLLDVVVIQAASRRDLLRAMPKVYDGSHIDLPEVQVLRGRSVVLSGTPSVPVGGDGEPLGRLPTTRATAAQIDVLPGAMSLLRPRDAR